MVLLLHSQLSTSNQALEYQYEILSHPSCRHCPTSAQVQSLRDTGWGSSLVYYANGHPATDTYPTFRVTYNSTPIATHTGVLTPAQTSDFFNRSYYRHHLATTYEIDTAEMTLPQLTSISRAIRKLTNADTVQNR